jgi:hypothetical protein
MKQKVESAITEKAQKGDYPLQTLVIPYGNTLDEAFYTKENDRFILFQLYSHGFHRFDKVHDEIQYSLQFK